MNSNEARAVVALGLQQITQEAWPTPAGGFIDGVRKLLGDALAEPRETRANRNAAKEQLSLYLANNHLDWCDSACGFNSDEDAEQMLKILDPFVEWGAM